MNTQTILQTSQSTLSGTMSFPEAVTKLLETGVEYYHVDYIEMRKTFYGIDGSIVTTPISYEDLPAIAQELNIAELRAAILDSQQNGQKYRDFSKRAMRAGVQSYFAFLTGKRVIYLGRQGDQHTEWFPGARPKTSVNI